MSNNSQDKFEDFLLQEYNNIAQAHFKSIETITSFFRYYLLIMSIPISAVAIISQIILDKNQLANFISLYSVPITVVLFIISFIGLFVCLYIISLRLDAMLYARTVNGIRKYFYDASPIDINLKTRMRVLPQSPQMPPYFESCLFLPVVAVFGILNSLYFAAGFFFVFKFFTPSFFPLLPIGYKCLICGSVFLFSHFFAYWKYSHHRELGYLRSNIIGIDIDGVLNRHREHFCKILKEKTSIDIDPEEIKVIPVHQDPGLNVTREDEKKVFNDPKYWTEMPPMENAAQRISNFLNFFRLKVYIFTHRPWPDMKVKEELQKAKELFFASCQSIPKIIKICPRAFKACVNPMVLITKEWLKRNGIKYNKLLIEEGNDFSSDPRIVFRNRFYLARKKKIRFFVEDDLEKALKLSFICDVVFLISHPYNLPGADLFEEENKMRKELPSNIIRVKNWDEIYQYVRRLS